MSGIRNRKAHDDLRVMGVLRRSRTTAFAFAKRLAEEQIEQFRVKQNPAIEGDFEHQVVRLQGGQE
jgi:hypothetical protein